MNNRNENHPAASADAASPHQRGILTAVRECVAGEKAVTLRSGLRGGARTGQFSIPTAGDGSGSPNHNQTGIATLDAARKQAAAEGARVLRSGLRAGARTILPPAGEGTGSGNHNQTYRRPVRRP